MHGILRVVANPKFPRPHWLLNPSDVPRWSRSLLPHSPRGSTGHSSRRARDATPQTPAFCADRNNGTLIEAWASLKSFRPKNETKRDPPDDPGNPTVDFHGEKRSNETHQSTTDPEARLAKKGKGKEAKLAFSGNALMENRNGLLVDFRVVQASGYAERETAISMLDEELPGSKRVTVAGDKGYDTRDCVRRLRELNATPHIARNERAPGGSAIDRRTARHPGYLVSQVVRKLIEESFGWMKTVGNFRKTRYKGTARTRQAGYMVAAAYNLIRITRLIAAAA